MLILKKYLLLIDRKCQYYDLPSLTNGAAIDVVEEVVARDERILFECEDHYRLVPGTSGSTSSVQSVTCLPDRTFTF